MWLLNEKPSELNAVNPLSVTSALVVLLISALLTPLDESTNLFSFATLLSFTHTKSGWNSNPVILCVLPFPVQVIALNCLAG